MINTKKYQLWDKVKIVFNRTKNGLTKSFLNFLGTKKFIDNHLSLSALKVAIETAVGNNIEGDYLEFGVYKGHSFIEAYKHFQITEKIYHKKGIRRFFAFDSFQGLPESKEEHRPKHYERGEYFVQISDFKKNLQKNKVSEKMVKIIPGFYDKTLNKETKNKYRLTKAAVIYIDVDLYKSTAYVFDFLTDLLDTGSIIVIDDWFRHKGVPDYGIQKACHEWLDKNPHIHLIQLHLWRRVAFIVHKVNR